MNKEKDIAKAEEWQYDAFISYRHTQPDSFVAQTLHKYLESFKLPRSVVRHKGEESDGSRRPRSRRNCFSERRKSINLMEVSYIKRFPWSHWQRMCVEAHTEKYAGK